MQDAKKPKSRFFRMFLLCVMLLAGGALLGLFVLPDWIEAYQTGTAAPTATPTASAATTPAPTTDGTPTPSPEDEPLSTPAPTPIDAGASIADTIGMAKQSVVAVIASFGKAQEVRSGFVYGNGFIVTTYAGLENASGYAIVVEGEAESTQATAVQHDAAADLLVLTTRRTDLVPATIAPNDAMAGDFVFAVGTPLNLRFMNLVSRGLIAGVGIKPFDDGGDYLITDAATNPGHAGGALFNSRGEIVGMLTDLRADAGFDIRGDPIAALGMSFARPIKALIPTIDTLAAGEEVQRPSLEMTVIDLTGRQKAALGVAHGVRVTMVKTGGTAQLAGIQNGDVLTNLNGVGIPDAATFYAMVGAAPIGQNVQLTRVKNGVSAAVEVQVINALE